MDYNPLLNKLIRHRNPQWLVEDPLLDLLAAMVKSIVHLEAQNPPAETQQSEQPSSQATVRLEGMSDTSTTSYSWSSPVSQAGILPPSVQQAIAASYSFQRLPGDPQAEVTLSIRIPKASTPPDGSPSPSTGAPTPEGNGVAGSWNHCNRGVCQVKDYCVFPESCVASDAPPASTSPAENASREGREKVDESEFMRRLHSLPHYNGPGSVNLNDVLDVFYDFDPMLAEARDER